MTEFLTSTINSAGWYAPLYYLLGFILSALLPFIPTPLIGALGGSAFGFWPALLFGIVGMGLGAATALGMARLVGRPLLVKLVRPATWRAWEDLLGIRSLLVWGLIFFVLNLDFAVMAAGLSPLPLWQLWLTAMLARLPWLIASTWFGETFLQNDQLLLPTILLVIAGLFLLGRARPYLQTWLLALAEQLNGRPRR